MSEQRYGTPLHIVRAAEAEIGGRFALDVCAEAWSAKARRWYSLVERGEDGLALP